MTERIDLFDSTSTHFTDAVLDVIRKETFGTDIGQNSWLTVDEYERLLPLLDLSADSHVLEVASGSGGRRSTWRTQSDAASRESTPMRAE